jgi:predicted DNA-binding transcriptional regulator YafY
MLTDSPTGIVNVQPILEAIDVDKGIEFDYWSFNKQTKKRLVAIPYFLRTWERRWYLVAEPDNHHHGQSVFALERMENIVLTEHEMQPSSNISVQDYFKGSFGINHSDEQVSVTIRIRVYGTQADYVRALPIHESQREIERTDEWTDFEMDLVPCYNFYQQLLWHREKLEVLSPASVRDELQTIIRQMLSNYDKK